MSVRVKLEGRPSDRVQQLTERLRSLKADFREFGDCMHVSGLQVHPRLREEIARIYAEHGGMPILMHITKLSRDTILKWYVRYKENPAYFQSMPLHRRCYRKGEKQNEEEDFRRYLTQVDTFQQAKTVEEIRSRLQREVLTEIDTLNQSLDRENGLTSMQKLEICRLVLKAGDVKPVALLLGLTRRAILNWKGYFAQAVFEIHGHTKSDS